jgi:hypothetical protein
MPQTVVDKYVCLYHKLAGLGDADIHFFFAIQGKMADAMGFSVE